MTTGDLSQAAEQVADELATLGPLSELARELRVYPVRLLTLICTEYDRRGGAVPDHALRLLPYLGETALRALVAGGYVARADETLYAIQAYVPTDAGREAVDRAASAPKRASSQPKRR